MEFGATKLASPIASLSCSVRSFSQDDRKARIDLAGQLELLSDILTKAELESQNKLLLVIIYKHKNQLRKQKTLQYAQRIAKMVARLDVNAVKGCINDLRVHISNTCRCIWESPMHYQAVCEICTGNQLQILIEMIP